MAAHGIHSGLLSTGIGDKSHAAISPIWQLLLSSIGLELVAHISFPHGILGVRTLWIVAARGLFFVPLISHQPDSL